MDLRLLYRLRLLSRSPHNAQHSTSYRASISLAAPRRAGATYAPVKRSRTAKSRSIFWIPRNFATSRVFFRSTRRLGSLQPTTTVMFTLTLVVAAVFLPAGLHAFNFERQPDDDMLDKWLAEEMTGPAIQGAVRVCENLYFYIAKC